MSTNLLTTDRLFLEPLSEADTQFIIELVNTAGWISFIGDRNIHSEEDALAYIRKINGNENITYRVVKLLHTNTPIGLVTLIKRVYLDHPDIGFAFLPAHFKQGYAFEASNAVLQHLINREGIEYILAETLPENTVSIQLIEKLGLQFEKEIRVENETLLLYGASKVRLLGLNKA